MREREREIVEDAAVIETEERLEMDGGGSNVRSSYYNVLGIRKDASVSDVRAAYRKLAMVLLPLLLFRISQIFIFDQSSFYLTLFLYEEMASG